MDYRLIEGATVRASASGLSLECPLGHVPLPAVDAVVGDALLRLAGGPVAAGALRCQILERAGEAGLDQLARCLDALARSRSLLRELTLGGRVAARMQPLEAELELRPRALRPGAAYRLSRFAILRRRPDGGLWAETPLGKSRLEVDDLEAVRLVASLVSDATASELAALVPRARGDEIEALLSALLAEGYLGEVGEDGLLDEDRDATLRQWEPHDLYFHARSRLGRQLEPIGGSFRFKGELPPQPCVKPAPAGPVIRLAAPDLRFGAPFDLPLQVAIERRASIRDHGGAALSAEELGVFLYRAARNRRYVKTEIGEFTSRPYPSGGASYELEVYLTIEACRGIPRGFYYYNPADHTLIQLQRPNDDTALLVQEAWQATAGTCWPQVVLSLAARFQRVSWKYSGMAYATILKNAGAVYQTFYLVATAMNLAPCGLGIGNPDRFCRLAGTDYLQESSVGEFALGTRSA